MFNLSKTKLLNVTKEWLKECLERVKGFITGKAGFGPGSRFCIFCLHRVLQHTTTVNKGKFLSHFAIR